MAQASDSESSLGKSEYARRTQRLIQLIGDVRALGLAVFALLT